MDAGARPAGTIGDNAVTRQLEAEPKDVQEDAELRYAATEVLTGKSREAKQTVGLIDRNTSAGHATPVDLCRVPRGPGPQLRT
ncbi:hypothetical protein ABIB25_005911 [Nakamurella sp. UYEF19]